MRREGAGHDLLAIPAVMGPPGSRGPSPHEVKGHGLLSQGAVARGPPSFPKGSLSQRPNSPSSCHRAVPSRAGRGGG